MKPLVESRREVVDAAVRWVAKRDRGLSPAEQKELDHWLGDADHAEAFQKYSSSWESAGRARESGKADLLLTKIHRIERQKRVRRVAAGSALAMVLLAGSFWWQSTRTEPVAETARAVVIMPKHELLPDGSVVDAPAGARYVVDFAGQFRRVHLTKGEALFSVAKDANRPFIVDAGGVEFRAVGTAFSVHLDEAKVGLLVTEGKVAVDRAAEMSASTVPVPASGLGIGSVAMVQAGEQVTVERQAVVEKPVVVPVAALEISERLAWRNPQVEFSGAPLSEVVATINRYSSVKYVVDDADLAKTELSGLFRADDGRAFEQMLVTGMGVEVIRTDTRVLLRRASSR